MKNRSLLVFLLSLLLVVVPAAGSAVGQLPAQSDEGPAPYHRWSHGFPLDPTTGLPASWILLGQSDDAESGEDDERDDEDLPLVPGRTIEFATDEGSWLSLDVSPDGSTIVFDLLGDLYTIPVAGGAATRITEGLAWDAMPRFSPDGSELLFVSDRSGAENLWVLDLETPADADDDDRFRQVTRGSTSNYASPDWSPDGEYIVVSKAAGNFGMQKLWLIHAEQGGNGFQLTEEPQSRRELGAAMSSDGRWIWFAYRTGPWSYNAVFPQYQLAVYDRETGDVSTRSFRYGSAFRPTLSPDGRWLVYGTRHETDTGLRIRDLESGEERWLAYPVQRDDQEALASRDVLPGMDFTPDSTALVASYGGRIWRIPVDGGAATEIPFEADVRLDAGPELDFDYPVDDRPEFEVRQIRDAVPSPDGARLAFTAIDRLYVADWPDGAPRRLTDHELVEAFPVWSPDGSRVAFATWDQEEGGHIWSVDTSGGDATRLTALSGTYTDLAWSPDGERIVAVRGPARAYQEATGPFAGGAATDLVWIPAGGGDHTLIAPLDGRSAPHFGPSSDRIYLHAGRDGLVSIRWDGTDQRAHLKVTGPPFPGAQGPPPSASSLRIAPTGDRVLAGSGMDLWVIGAIPVTGGEAPSISVANPERAPVPVRKLTDIGGEFATWGADGRKVHWSIGNAHVVYDLDAADARDEEIEAHRKARAEADGESDDDEEESDAGEGEESEDEAGDSPDEDEDEDGGPEPYEPFEKRVLVTVPRDLPTGVVVLRGARVITMNGDEVIENADLVVENHRIRAVGPRGEVEIPGGATEIDLAGKTIVPGFVDTHAHMWPNWGLHKSQAWMYMANLAWGVTTTRDPQTATTDVLTYSDKVETGEMIGPRVYSTGPGVFAGERWRDADHARDVLRRYSEYYDTKTIKMYMAGNRQVRQWIINAAREQELMPTTEGGLDLEYNLTMAIDGYPGQEHSFPIYPLYRDVVQLFGQARTVYSPTLLVTYGGPFGENWFYTKENPYHDEKVQRFFPYDELATKARRRGAGAGGSPGPGGWFLDEEYAFQGHAAVLADIVEAGGRAGVGSHGQFDGLGYHWELWQVASGGLANHDALRVATLHGAEAIGVEKDLGSLEAGKIADLVVLDGNPLENLRHTADVAHVMRGGRLYDADTLNEIYPRQRPAEGLYWLQSWDVAPAAGMRRD